VAPSFQQFRFAFYFVWVVTAACAVGLLLVGSTAIAVGVFIGLAFFTLGLVEFERFAEQRARSIRP
jgi:membrane protein implicated in regulation of membrane protease activity